jgi:hypothetical protein
MYNPETPVRFSKYKRQLRDCITTGIWLFAEYQIFCRVFFWHSAKKLFAECFFNTRQRRFKNYILKQ